MAELRWTAAQVEAISERSAELLVSAAAGSGKTAVLVERVLRLALGSAGESPVPLENLLVVTFTRAAASELLGRLHQALLKSRAASIAGDGFTRQANIRQQLTALPRAQISTIHSFCAEVIRRHGDRIGLELGSQLDEQEAALLRHELATELLDERLGESAEVRELALWWGGQDGVGPEDLSQVAHARGLREPLLRLHDLYCALIDPQAWNQQQVQLPSLSLDEPDLTDPAVAAFESELVEWREQAWRIDEQAAAMLGALSPLPAYLELSARRCRIAHQLTLANGWKQAGELLQLMKETQDDIKWKPTLLESHKRDIEDGATKDWLDALHKPLAEQANELLAELKVPWEQVAARENAARANLALLWELMLDFDRRYTAFKRSRNQVDFNDLERHALRILALHEADRIMLDEAGRPRPSQAALEYRARFEAVLVDEYQDTNSLQEAIVSLVTRDGTASAGRPRFSVGDIKQSIYDFRGAEPALFAARGRQLSGMSGTQGRVVRLSENFRSREAVLSAINAVFDGLMSTELGGEDYAPNRLLPGCDYAALFGNRGANPASDIMPRLHLVNVAPGVAGQGSSAGDEADDEESMARAEAVYQRVADVLHEIHAGGQSVYDPDTGSVRPVAWRDMAVLLRSARGRMETLRAVLDTAGIPYYAPARSGFYERPEVSDALSLLRVIDNPRQDIALAAALTGPALGLSPAQLFELSRVEVGTDAGCLWDKVSHVISSGAPAELHGPLLPFVEQLVRWRRRSRLEPLPVLLWDVYTNAGLLATAAAMGQGPQRLANLYQLHELARTFSSFERQGLARFMRYLEHSRRAQGDLGEAARAGAGEDVVQVMTVHQAKGLEFPVVVIPDVDRRFNLRDIGADVLAHKDAGLGGRFVDMRGVPPERGSTLGLRRIKRRKQQDLLSQELRILYVALTRARERLELVAAVDPAQQTAGQSKTPAAASCWLDWLARILGPGISAVLSGGAPTWDGAHWQVLARAPAAPAEQADVPAATLDAVDISAIERRLAFVYPFGRDTVTPAKVTVTELAKQPGLAATEDRPAEVPELAVTTDSTVPALNGSIGTARPLLRGTAIHLLLQAVDPRQLATAAELKTTLAALSARGLLDDAVAATIDLPRIAEALELLRAHLLDPGAELHRELPFALLIPAADVNPAPADARDEAAHTDGGGRVYVQGVIDLLAVTGDAALVVDFKSDRGATAADLIARYSTQLAWYCRAVHELLPHHSVSWALLGLDAPVLAGPFLYSPDSALPLRSDVL